MKLYHVTGHDIDDCKTDLFVVARNVTQVKTLWNQYCLDQEWPRSEEDDGDDLVEYDPTYIRIILPAVTGTPYDDEPRVIPWDEFEMAWEA